MAEVTSGQDPQEKLTEFATRPEADHSPEDRPVTRQTVEANRLADLGNFSELTQEAFGDLDPKYLAGVKATAYRMAMKEHHENARFLVTDDPSEVARVRELGSILQKGLSRSLIESANGIEVTQEKIAEAQRLIDESKQKASQEEDRPGQYQ